MSTIETLGKTEFLEAAGDIVAHEADTLIHVPGEDATVSINANPAAPRVGVEFTPKPHEDDPDINFALNPLEKLP